MGATVRWCEVSKHRVRRLNLGQQPVMRLWSKPKWMEQRLEYSHTPTREVTIPDEWTKATCVCVCVCGHGRVRESMCAVGRFGGSECRGQRSPRPAERATDLLTARTHTLPADKRRKIDSCCAEGTWEKRECQKPHIAVLSLARLEVPNTWQAATKERETGRENNRVWGSGTAQCRQESNTLLCRESQVRVCKHASGLGINWWWTQRTKNSMLGWLSVLWIIQLWHVWMPLLMGIISSAMY